MSKKDRGPNSPEYNPNKASNWAARFLAAECRRYGEMVTTNKDGLARSFLTADSITRHVHAYALERSAQLSELFGVTVVATHDEGKVPDSYSRLKLAVLDRKLLYVSQNNQETAVWGETANWVLRSCHDLEHVAQEFTYSVDDEIRLGCLQASQLYQWMLNKGERKDFAALCALWLCIDLAGQAFYYSVSGGGFCPDQRDFLASCLKHGVLTGTREYWAEADHG